MHNFRIVFLYSIIAICLGGIFIFDSLSKFEIAAAVFYIVVILAGARFSSYKSIIALSIISTILIILSFLLTKQGNMQSGLINAAIALMALYLTTYIVLRTKLAEMRAIRATEQLTRIARIQTLGELTASIAHEINQPLAATMASAHASRNWLKRDKPNIDRACQALERIIEEAQRASDVIARIRRLSKNEISKRELLDFNDITKEAIDLSIAFISHHDIELQWNKSEKPLMVEADRVQIMQVIGNLFLNAVEALRQRKFGERFITVKTYHHEGKVFLRMTDTGTGFQTGDLIHIFDAFWTKREGGTGLGLTLCRAIIEAHKGQISAKPNPHGGAIFEIMLPEVKIAKNKINE